MEAEQVTPESRPITDADFGDAPLPMAETPTATPPAASPEPASTPPVETPPETRPDIGIEQVLARIGMTPKPKEPAQPPVPEGSAEARIRELAERNKALEGELTGLRRTVGVDYRALAAKSLADGAADVDPEEFQKDLRLLAPAIQEIVAQQQAAALEPLLARLATTEAELAEARAVVMAANGHAGNLEMESYCKGLGMDWEQVKPLAEQIHETMGSPASMSNAAGAKLYVHMIRDMTGTSKSEGVEAGVKLAVEKAAGLAPAGKAAGSGDFMNKSYEEQERVLGLMPRTP